MGAHLEFAVFIPYIHSYPKYLTFKKFMRGDPDENG